jgi:5-methylcytosine-specific restriction protein A
MADRYEVIRAAESVALNVSEGRLRAGLDRQRRADARRRVVMTIAPRAFRPAHAPSRRVSGRVYDERRGSSAQRGYGAAWRRARAAHLAEHPLCVECERQGSSVPATVVDHIAPHRGDMALFWDSTNWQSLCATCQIFLCLV